MDPLIRLRLISLSLGVLNFLVCVESLEDSRSTVIVNILKGTASVLSSISTAKYLNREERVGILAKELQENARVSQEPVRQYLETLKDPHLQIQTLWAQNAMILKKAPADVILHLKTHFSHLLSVRTDSAIARIDPPTSSDSNVSVSGKPRRIPWGVKRIQAAEAVKHLQSSISGPVPQIRIANIDTGVQGTHETLRENYLGAYGWLDPYDNTQVPTSEGEHGTHTMGTICGSMEIGVFPLATWMACKGCRPKECLESILLECSQFVMCPTLADGTSPNCSMAPHVVSCSWGTPEDDPWFAPTIDAWRAAGIIPVFSIGNIGLHQQENPCGLNGQPGNHPRVIGVGATDEDDYVFRLSAQGPTRDGRVKPDFAAPGADIGSASGVGGDEMYITMSGTSMACPHVAGLAALLLAYDQSLTFDQIVEALKAGVETTPLKPRVVCGDIPSDTFPNHAFGYGLVNALRSLTYLIEKRKQ